MNNRKDIAGPSTRPPPPAPRSSERHCHIKGGAPVPCPVKSCSPLAPRGRGVGGEGLGACQTSEVSKTSEVFSQHPSPPTPLPQGARGGRTSLPKNRRALL